MRTHRPPSALEAMIDRACGLAPSMARIMVRLECPKCKQGKQVPAGEHDPEGTATIKCPCHKCRKSSEDAMASVQWFDKEGAELFVDGPDACASSRSKRLGKQRPDRGRAG